MLQLIFFADDLFDKWSDQEYQFPLTVITGLTVRVTGPSISPIIQNFLLTLLSMSHWERKDIVKYDTKPDTQ